MLLTTEFCRLAAQTTTTDPALSVRVAGKITNAAGQPLAKVNVTLRQVAPAPTSMFSATSLPDGTFEFTGAPPGTYFMYAERTGYMPQGYNTKPGVQYPSSARAQLTLAAGQSISGRDIQMVPATTLSGKVLDEDGDPVAGAQVRVLRRVVAFGQRRLAPMGFSTTDQTGEYRVANLTPAKYLIVASAPRAFDPAQRAPRKQGEQETNYVDTYYPGTVDVSAATSVETFAGRDLGGMHIPLKKAPVYHVRGRVDGAPKNATLRVFAAGTDDLYMAYTGGAIVQSDGSYDLADVAVGQHAVVVVNPGDSFRNLARRLVSVGTDEVKDFTLQILPPIVISGRIQIEGEEPPADTNNPPKPLPFRVNPGQIEGLQTNSGGIAKAEDDGTFVLPRLNPGKYRLMITGGTADMYWKSTRQGDVFLESNVLDVSDGNSAPLDIVYARNGGTVTAVAAADNGLTTGTGFYYFLPDSDELIAAQMAKGGTIPAGGQFTIKGIRPGAWHLFALEDSDPASGLSLSEIRKMLEGRGTPVVVKEKETVQVSAKIIPASDIEKLAAQIQAKQ